jgi:ABC-type spermidine/putrescine transport system permease subunit I
MTVPIPKVSKVPEMDTGRKKVSLTPYLFILPHLIFFIAFIGYPFFNGIWISLHQFDYLRPATNRFIGLQNYINLFSPGTFKFNEFWNAMGNTLEFVLWSVPFLVIIPLLLAVLLNTKTPRQEHLPCDLFCPLGAVRLCSWFAVVVDLPEPGRSPELLFAGFGHDRSPLAVIDAIRLDFDCDRNNLVDIRIQYDHFLSSLTGHPRYAV